MPLPSRLAIADRALPLPARIRARLGEPAPGQALVILLATLLATVIATVSGTAAARERAEPLPIVLPETPGRPKIVEAGSRWVKRMNGLTGGTVNALAISPDDPGTLFAATLKGLFRSTDGGVNWERISIPIEGRVADLAIDPSNGDVIHLAVPCAYLRSTDGGESWSDRFPATCVENVDLDPSTNRVLIHNRNGDLNRFAAAEYSTDGGLTFTTLVLPDRPALTGIAMDVIHGTPGGYVLGYSSDSRQLYRTVDNGATWENLTENVRGTEFLNVADIAVRPGRGNEYLVSERRFSGSAGSVIHHSTDGGQTWMEVAAGAFSEGTQVEFHFDPSDNSLIHYIDLRSTDGGFNWVNLDPTIGVRGRAISVVATAAAANRIYAGGDGFGVELSEDAGASWERSNRGLNGADVVDHAVSDSAIVAIADRQGIFRSTDFGQRWEPVRQDGLEAQSAFSVRLSPSGREGGATFSGAGTRTAAVTSDGGASWTLVDLGATVSGLGGVAALDDGTVLVAATVDGDSGVFRLSTAGVIDGFSAFDGFSSGFTPDIVLAADPADTRQVVAAFSAGGAFLYASADGGESWAPAGSGLGEQPEDLVFDPNVPGRVFAVTGDGLFESTDGGASFAARSTRPAEADSVDVNRRFVDLLVAGRTTADRGGLSSSDGGASWLAMTNLLTDGDDWLPRIIRFSTTGTSVLATDQSFGTTGFAVRGLDVTGSRLAPMALAEGDRFGTALAAAGARIAVGVPGDDQSGLDAGAVYIFRREGLEVVLEEVIPAPAGAAAGFGQALALDGDRLVIGTGGDSARRLGAKGTPLRAAIFERLGQGWAFRQPLVPVGSSGADAFGSTVALSGDSILIGAPGDDVAGTDAGAAYQFAFTDSVASLTGKLMPPTGVSGGRFGQALALTQGSGGVFAAVGSPFGQAAGGGGQLTAGLVDLYAQVGANLLPRAAIGGNAASTSDRFGAAVALAGDRLVVGSPGESSNAGAAYLFSFDGSAASRERRITADIPVVGGLFGVAVATTRGQTAIGAPGRQRAFLYDGDLALLESFRANAGQTNFGSAVALSDQALAIGVPDTNGDRGAVDLAFSVDLIFLNAFE